MKPYYSTTELATIFGKTYNSTRTLMKNLNINANKVGNSVIFYLSDIRDNAPQLYASMKETQMFDIIEVDDE